MDDNFKYFALGNKAVSDSLAVRTIDNCVSYILPVLDSLPPDFVLLDVGCGPASITIDIAQRYPSATILAVDLPQAIHEATKSVRKAGVTNIRLAEGNGMQLAAVADTPGFEALRGGCDVVHTHQVHMHVSDPLALMKQLRAAAKPAGGFVCCREADIGSAVFTPTMPALRATIKLADLKMRDSFAGRSLKGNALAAGFREDEVNVSVGEQLHDTLELRDAWLMLVQAATSGKVPPGILDQFEGGMDGFWKDLRDWKDTEGAWYAFPCSQVVCRRGD